MRPRFVAAVEALPTDCDERTAIEAILFGFADEDLPLPGLADHQVHMPFHAMGRTVPASNLVVVYAPFGTVVHVLALWRA